MPGHPEPYRSFAKVLALFYPDAGTPKAAASAAPTAPSPIHPSARLEEGVVGGARRGDRQGGRDRARHDHCGRQRDRLPSAYWPGLLYRPQCDLTHALVGNRVIIHAGASIGQDGFGFAMGKAGHLKVPQIGRVIIQDDVEIGANTTIDRGALRDTIIGEGTKIDNLVQIGHNVVIGRHCIIVAQTGISGSSELGDFVALGGQVGVVGHVKIGAGAQIAASSNVRGNVPPGVRWGGTPAKPARLWFRELTLFCAGSPSART